MKVRSKIYKGIEYVQMNELPNEQKEKILTSLNEEKFIKILIGEKIVSNCIQYKEYEHWFDNTFRKSVVVEEDVLHHEEPQVQMILGKA